ncbi:MAG: hypothetical protein RL033_1342 [Pseudomonadota bacterium]|jgi:hypothetical protein
MLGSGILEVGIGVVFVFLLVSLLCSAVREALEALTKTRAAYLEYGLRELLHDPSGSGLAKAFFNHPLIYGLYSGSYEPGRTDRRPGWLEKGRNLPSYIPASNFALALMDMAARGPRTDLVSSDPAGPPLSLANVRANVVNLDNPAVQRVLLTAIDSARGDLDTARANLEAWYDSGMDRVGGWYKRSTQWIILGIAILLVVAGNINTIVIAGYLYRNDAARAALVERAKAAVGDTEALKLTYQQTTEALDELQLPIGWTNGVIAGRRENASPEKTAVTPAKPLTMHDVLAVLNDALVVTFGWLLTAFAATLGAPFWFDVLKKVMVIRATSKGDVGADPTPKRARLRVASSALATAAAPTLTAPTLTAPSLAAHDAESEADCCEARALEPGEEMLDEELPVAMGGVI